MTVPTVFGLAVVRNFHAKLVAQTYLVTAQVMLRQKMNGLFEAEKKISIVEMEIFVPNLCNRRSKGGKSRKKPAVN